MSTTGKEKPTWYLSMHVSTLRQRVKEELGGDYVNFDFLWDDKGDEFVPFITLRNFDRNKENINAISYLMKRTPIIFEAKLVYEPKRVNGKFGKNRIDWNDFTKIDKSKL